MYGKNLQKEPRKYSQILIRNLLFVNERIIHRISLFLLDRCRKKLDEDMVFLAFFC